MAIYRNSTRKQYQFKTPHSPHSADVIHKILDPLVNWIQRQIEDIDTFYYVSVLVYTIQQWSSSSPNQIALDTFIVILLNLLYTQRIHKHISMHHNMSAYELQPKRKSDNQSLNDIQLVGFRGQWIFRLYFVYEYHHHQQQRQQHWPNENVVLNNGTWAIFFCYFIVAIVMVVIATK